MECKHISTETKISIIRTCVMSVLLYACETWTLRKKDKDLLLAFEMKCYRRILHIHWHQKITNVEVRRRVGNTRNIVQHIMERKLSLFGHICRMEDKRLVKGVVFGIMGGWTRRGRPSREWLDDIKEWCQMDILSQQDGTGPCTVEMESQTGIGHQRARAHGMMDGLSC